MSADSPTISNDQMTVELRLLIKEKYKTQRAAAEQWGVPPSYVSQVLSGQKQPSQKLLSELGLEKMRFTEYRYRFVGGEE